MQELTRHSKAVQRLVFEGKILEDDKTVKFYKIEKDSKLFLEVLSPILIKLEKENGDIISHQVTTEVTVEELKRNIENSEGLPFNAQRIFHRGRMLEDAEKCVRVRE